MKDPLKILWLFRLSVVAAIWLVALLIFLLGRLHGG
ncbi:Uncharacterised protein [Bordetella trematum]|uniref:Uncharacterized protein n=1 Tax=Bordetella trematum TaxID=123899 RepID=A0A157MLX2_9BORD|nr:Uncharacterised protein [Bordetella trematum]SAI09539.1 Uncharacterised protein [Bordetella trematum]SAI72647.1 Uncharacterised protein [Bordetella trematum]SUV97681.1 Uncharacterised protein [Bordetella trematum]